MSRESEETNLNPQESENAVSENTGRLKRNYCYVCKVQCTAEKNLLDHNKGKKHLNNVSLKNGEQRRNNFRNNSSSATSQKSKKPDRKKFNNSASSKSMKSVKKNLNDSTSKFAKSDRKNTNHFKGHKSQDGSSPVNEVADNTMSNSYRHTSRNNKYEFIQPDFENKFSRYQNSKQHYSNNYRNERHYEDRQYNDYSQWHHPPFFNSPIVPNTHNHDFRFGHSSQYYPDSGYYASRKNDYFSENRHPFFNLNYGESSYLPSNNPDNLGQNSDYSNINPVRFGNSEKRTSEDVAASSSKTSNEKQNDQIDTSSASISGDNVKDGVASKKISNFKIDIPKLTDKKRIRSRSLSASEGCSEKKANENQMDPDSASEEQRIKEWTNSLLETNNNQISRLIHPSNYKDKAAVNHLITKLSKSKRKEILTRTLRSNSVDTTENYDEGVISKDVNTSVESLNEMSDEITVILDSKEDSGSYLKQSNNFFEAVQKNKFHSKKNPDSDDVPNRNISLNQNSKKHCKINEKSKNSNVTSSNRTPENRKEKRSTNIHQEKNVKRKSLSSDSRSKGKKQKVSSNTERVETVNTSQASEMQDLNTPTTEHSFIPSFSSETPSEVSSDALRDLKKEITEHSKPLEVNQPVPPPAADSQNVLNQNLAFNSEISVDTLIQLFASGNVKVKEEFNDPVMDAIKEISPDELISACSSEFLKVSETANITPTNSNRRSLSDKPTSESSVKTVNQENRDSISQVITRCQSDAEVSSTVTSESTVPSSVAHRRNPSFSNVSLSDKPEDQDSSNNVDKSSNNSLHETCLLNKSISELPLHINRLIKQLKDIASEEESVKQNLDEAKSKISDYNALLEEWKSKKKKLQKQEEDLRKKRNEIIKSLQNTVKTNEDSEEEQQIPSLPEKIPPDNEPTSSQNQKVVEDSVEVEKSSKKSHFPPVISPVNHQKQSKNISPASSESDEITILPSPVKVQPPEIIIFDDAEENRPVTTGCKNKLERSMRNEIVTNIVTTTAPTLYDMKNMNAHLTVINCLVVFEDFLYTCSNDNTAKRFSLKDPSLTVVYLHTAKNVTEVVVEKVQNEALVFTSCSIRIISLFIASSGTKIKTFFPPSAVMSICKGWGKFYSGLADGTVNVYNWKYEETEIVKTETPASRIATAHQGRLHVLVILSSEGNISIRDAETGLLIRYCKIAIKLPSWMTLHNDLVYLSSSDKVLIILDIMSGRVEQRLNMNNHTTGLAVYDDYIFTISYTGIINCCNKDRACDRMLYYGAGKNGLTCVHVYQDWVFTGNRKGEVSLFHFDPCSAATCEMGKCGIVYGSNEDLEYHVEKDHLSKKKTLSKCNWQGCDFIFPKNADITDKMNHIRSHIYEMRLFA